MDGLYFYHLYGSRQIITKEHMNSVAQTSGTDRWIILSLASLAWPTPDMDSI